jgi:beta-phosphoglucomutase-like phosphatase (HAD superfamily)
MITVKIRDLTAEFAEDKDAAAQIREEQIRPALKRQETVVLDFSGVTLATQSFVHALISDILRTFGVSALEHLEFKKCVKGVRGIVETVVQYSLEGLETKPTDKASDSAPVRAVYKKTK